MSHSPYQQRCIKQNDPAFAFQPFCNEAPNALLPIDHPLAGAAQALLQLLRKQPQAE